MMRSAILAETLKLLRSPVGTIGTLALVLGVLALVGGLILGIASGSPRLVAQAKFSGIDVTAGWQGLLSTAAQITAAGALLGFGVVLAWMFAREFAEGTVAGLFALPVTRGRIAFAKFAVHGLWVLLVGSALTGALLGLGLLLGYGPPGAEARAGLARQFALTLLSGALTAPVAWVASLTRSLLAGTAAAILLVIIGQIGALAGTGAWLPPAAPALWALSEGTEAGAAQLALAVLTAGAFAGFTCAHWARLQLDS
ncbi:ABC transporter permease [Brevibacterium album]|uniref:ABC transporter permease n=1 Tax=Brevibacterium album TaxID=417948 RepID=UPI000403172F|nr:ABC transporter permease [Brevibacterium album]